MAGHTRVLFKEKYPNLIKHFKNPSDLDEAWIGDKRKFEAVCLKGHIVKADLKSVQMEDRVKCIYCAGHAVYPISKEQKHNSLEGKGFIDPLRNDFWAKNPYKANQLLDKNDGFNVTHSSFKDAKWLCGKGHVYKIKYNTKANIGSECGYCTNRKMWPVSDEQLGFSIRGELDKIDPLRNDLLARNPNLAQQIENPRDALTLGSRDKVHGICKNSLHKIFKPLAKLHNCEYCSGKSVYPLTEDDKKIILAGDNNHLFDVRNDFHKHYPMQAKLFKNISKSFEVTRNQTENIDCICPEGHEWIVNNSSYIKSGCSKCREEARSKLPKTSYNGSFSKEKQRPFTETHPETFKDWAWDLNENLDPNLFTFGSNQKVFWLCKECGESFERIIKNHVRYKICETCSTANALVKKIKRMNKEAGLLADVLPEIAKEYSQKNDRDISTITIETYYRAVWNCSICDYEWTVLVLQRGRGKGKCPKCEQRILIEGVNDLKTVAPDLARDWIENYPMSTVKANSREKVNWRCHKCAYEWCSSIKGRAIKNHGCIKCFNRTKVSKGQAELSDFIRSLGHEIAEDAKPFKASRMELDVFIPELSIGIEYNGDYWHSDKIIKKRRGVTAEERHLEKKSHCDEAGIALAFVWENDWQNSKDEVKKSLGNLIDDNTLDPILNKYSTEIEPSAFSQSLSPRKSIVFKQYERPMSETKREMMVERYLTGESPGHFHEELNIDLGDCYRLIRKLGLVSLREERGVGKNGQRIVPKRLYEGFKADFQELSADEILKKYSISYNYFRKLVRDLELKKTKKRC